MNVARTLLQDRPLTGKPIWTLEIEGNTRPDMVRGDGDRVYLRNDKDTLYAVNGLTGGVAWKHKAESFLYEPVRHPSGMVLTGGQDGRLLALDEATGEVRWTFSTGTDRVEALNNDKSYGDRTHYHPQAVVGPDGAIYVGSDHGVIHVLDAQGQTQREIPVMRDRMLFGQKRVDLPVFPSLAEDGRLVVTTSDGEVHALDQATGKRQWARKFGDRPTVLEGPRGDLLVQEGFTTLHSVDPSTGTPRWTNSTGFQGFLDVRVAGDRILVESCESATAVRSLSPDDGQELWRFTGESGIVAVRDDGTVWAGKSFGHSATRLDPATGHPIGETVKLQGWSSWTEMEPGPGGTLIAMYQHGSTISAFAPDRIDEVPDAPPSGDILAEAETVLIGDVRLPIVGLSGSNARSF